MISILHEHVLRLILQHLPLKQKFVHRSVCQAFNFVLNRLLYEQKVLSIDQQLFSKISPCEHLQNELIVLNSSDFGSLNAEAVLEKVLSRLPSIRHLILGETKALHPIQVAKSVVRHCKHIRCVQLRDLGAESDVFHVLIYAYGHQLEFLHIQYMHDQRCLKQLFICCSRLRLFETVGRYVLEADLLSFAEPALEEAFARPGWRFSSKVKPQDARNWPVAQSLRCLGYVWASQLLLIIEFKNLQELQVICGQHVHLLFLIAELPKLQSLSLIGCPSSERVATNGEPTLTELDEFISRLLVEQKDDQHSKLLQHLEKFFTLLDARDWMVNSFITCFKWILLNCPHLIRLDLCGLWLSLESMQIVSRSCPELQHLVMRMQPINLDAELIQEEEDAEEIIDQTEKSTSVIYKIFQEKLEQTLNEFEDAFRNHQHVNTLVLDCCNHLVQKLSTIKSLRLNSTTVMVHIK